MKDGYVKTDISNGLATVEFFHPSHNSLPSNLLKGLADAISEAGRNDEVKIILLKSGGDRTFCAGASFDELMAIDNLPAGIDFFMGFAHVINACRKCPKLILGRVQGKAVGGGVGLASAVDYCMATRYASVRLSELAIGIGPFVVGPAVERKVGHAAMSQMAINPDEWQTAEWAQQKGLFQEVFKTTEQLDDYISYFSDKLLQYNPEAISSLKSVFWEGTERWDELLRTRAEISGRLVLSSFTKKALKAFKAKS